MTKNNQLKSKKRFFFLFSALVVLSTLTLFLYQNCAPVKFSTDPSVDCSTTNTCLCPLDGSGDEILCGTNTCGPNQIKQGDLCITCPQGSTASGSTCLCEVGEYNPILNQCEDPNKPDPECKSPPTGHYYFTPPQGGVSDLCINSTDVSAVATSETTFVWTCSTNLKSINCSANICLGSNSYISGNKCLTCPANQRPNSSRTGCENIPFTDEEMVIDVVGTEKISTETTKFVIIIDDSPSMIDEIKEKVAPGLEVFLNSIYELKANTEVYIYYLNRGLGYTGDTASEAVHDCKTFNGVSKSNYTNCLKRTNTKGLTKPVHEIIISQNMSQSDFNTKKQNLLNSLKTLTVSPLSSPYEQITGTLLNTFWQEQINYKIHKGDKVSFILFTDEDDDSSMVTPPNSFIDANNLLRPTYEMILGSLMQYRLSGKYTKGTIKFSAYVLSDNHKMLLENVTGVTTCASFDTPCKITSPGACNTNQKNYIKDHFPYASSGMKLESIDDFVSCEDSYSQVNESLALWEQSSVPWNCNDRPAYTETFKHYRPTLTGEVTCQLEKSSSNYVLDQRTLQHSDLHLNLDLNQNIKNILDDWFKTGSEVRYKLNIVANFKDLSTCPVTGESANKLLTLAGTIGTAGAKPNARIFDICQQNYSPIFNDILRDSTFLPDGEYNIGKNFNIKNVLRIRGTSSYTLNASEYSYSPSTGILKILNLGLLQEGDQLKIIYNR